MTTIAWDGKTLAGDKQTTWGGTAVKTKKIFKSFRNGQQFIYGCAGLAHECRAFTQWADGTIEKPSFTDLSVLAIDSNGGIWHTNQSMLWVKMDVHFWAIGSGCDYALAAMACGKSSEEAIKISMIFDVNTGIGIDRIKLK